MKTETLQIHHIAKRLPYGLKIQTPYGIKEVKGIDTINEIIGLLYWIDNKQSMSFSIDCKPILFPLSCLTEPITIKGEIFVPLLRIADLIGIKYSSYIINGNSIDFVFDKSYRRENVKTREVKKGRFWFNIFKTISFNCSDHGLMLYFDQCKALEKLLEWHIDYENLIEKGLAISVFDLDKNPYA